MNKQITEDYCSFETAKLLKEKGFMQDCDYATSWYAAEYYKNPAQGEWFEGEHQIIEDIDDKCTISYLSDKGVFIPAPTHQMALKWLREVHNIYIDILTYTTGKSIQFRWVGYDNGRLFSQEEGKTIYFNSYNEAVEAAIKYTLENLI